MQIGDPAIHAVTPIAERQPQGKPSNRQDFERTLAADAPAADVPASAGVHGDAIDVPTGADAPVAQDGAGLDGLPGGVLYPWQLMAQTAMSQLGQHAYSTAARADGLTTHDGIQIVQKGTISNTAVALAAAVASHGTTEVHAVTLARSGDTASAIMKDMRGTASAGAEQALASLPTWSKRFQRRVEDAQGRATVWLRDYQLGEQGLASTIDEIIASYGPSRPVWRIVVNGSEVWRRPSNPSEET
ncbi:MAG TPA: hypothetical protein DDZ67_09060 [Xanthomonadaceae bacterium]|nr:hypothetical protein [Xanthomonadaceae bacterium]